VEKDFKQALHWYMLAAQQGHAGAQCQAGYCHEKGMGTEQDSAKAFELYLQSAEGGDETGCNNLGFMYEKGYGCEKNVEKAVAWYRKAAELGMALGHKNLAIHLEGGTGCKKDEKAALEHYRKAQAGGIDCTEAIKRLTTDRSSNRIAYTIMTVFAAVVAVVCGVMFFSTWNSQDGVLLTAGLAGTKLCLRMLRRFRPMEEKTLHPVWRVLLLILGIVCALLCAFLLLAFFGTAPDYDFSALWLSVCALAGCIAALVRWKKK